MAQLYKRDFSSNQWKVLQVDSTNSETIFTGLCLPNGTVVAAGDFNISWTTDEGAHWTKEWTLPDSATVSRNGLAYSPEGILIAGTFNGIYITDKTDTLWQRIGANLPDSYFPAVFVAPNGNYFASSKTHIYRSTDSGKTWTEPDTESYHRPIVCFTANKQRILFAGSDDGLYASLNNGQNWSRINDSLNVTGLFKSSDGYIYVTTIWGVWRSTDDGIT